MCVPLSDWGLGDPLCRSVERGAVHKQDQFNTFGAGGYLLDTRRVSDNSGGEDAGVGGLCVCVRACVCVCRQEWI